jgi:raffinose/stachyose/melibiose transport system substrate-binding protein
MSQTSRRPSSNPSRHLIIGLTAVSMIVGACAPAAPAPSAAAPPTTSQGASTNTQATGVDPDSFSVLLTTENTQVPAELQRLAAGSCASANAALPLALQATPGAQIQQQIQLLASQNSLPVMFAPSQSFIVEDGALQKAGYILDIKKALTDLGVADQMLPGAQAVIDQLYPGVSPTLPFQYNVEGIFYNKKMFAEHGVTVPKTWDELVAAATKLKAAGVQAFTAGGKSGWPVSRWIGAYIFRSLGGDAMAAVANKTAKLTDPGYVAAAQAIQDLGKAGLFPVGVASEDLPTAYNDLVTGKAAMQYQGTWLLANINDPAQNTVGLDQIGLMSVPPVTGGKGDIGAWPTNVGSPNAINAKLYGPKVSAWLKCIAVNYPDSLMTNQTAYSGFKASHAPVLAAPSPGAAPPPVPPLTTEVANDMATAKSSVLWFEALSPSAKFTADAGANSVLLLNGSMTALEYMTLLQSDLDNPQ